MTVSPYGNGASGSLSGITLSYGGKDLTFGTSISAASESGQILFNDSSHLVIGTDATDTVAITPQGAPSADAGGAIVDPNTVYALGGNDTVDFSNSGAGVSNYLNGGFGADTINGGDANNHIYGNSMTSQVGATDPSSNVSDGGDTITVGIGSNYINGNAGADTINVGTHAMAATETTTAEVASTGFNRVFGGANDDTINIIGNGHNVVNGNSGNDTIIDSGFGDNTLRGGQGDDHITGGSGHSVLMGDVGNDTIMVHGSMGESVAAGQHIDIITGGAGSDTFDFSTTGAGQAALFGQNVYYQEITDFTHGDDKITLAAANQPMTTGAVGTASTVFANVHDAEVYAQTQLSGAGTGGGHVVESLAVGSADNTYLFYSEAGNAAANQSEVAGLGIIHLDGVTASSMSFTDFNGAGSTGS